jgi:hypothetical protein
MKTAEASGLECFSILLMLVIEDPKTSRAIRCNQIIAAILP